MTGFAEKTARRSFATAVLLLLAACSNAAQAATNTMFRNPERGCCLTWADHVEQFMTSEVTSVDTLDMTKVKVENGAPIELWSCHTMVIEGYVIEGHVPAEAIEKLLESAPKA